MPKRYFLSVAIFGLSVIFGILLYFLSNEISRLFSLKYSLLHTIQIITPIAIGVIATILMGMYFDKKVQTPNAVAVIFLIPYTIYLTGVGAGALCIFLMQGLSPFDPWSFLGKPLLIGLYGTPGALGVGVISYLYLILIYRNSVPKSTENSFS